MMVSGRPVSEEDLHAYVDGFLDADCRQQVERYLADHPEAAARIRGWQAAGGALRAAVAWTAEEPVPDSLSLARLVEARMAHRRAPWRLVASIAIGLTVGAAAGWTARGPSIPAGVAAVALEAMAAHRVFATDPAHPVEFGAGEQAEYAAWVAQRLGRPVTPPDLSTAGYRLVGGRLVATAHGAGCMFLYEGRDGQRVSLFVRPMGQRDMNAPMRPVEDMGAQGYAWARAGLGVSLVSSRAMPLHALANQVRDQLGSGA